MDYFPLFAQLRDQPCLVVGGGDVASRKVRALAAAGARVTVLAPEVCPALEELADTASVTWQKGKFSPEWLGDHLLVIAATSDPETNRAVADAARAARRLCNVVDDAAQSSFIVPGIVDRSPLVLAVSSGGHSPVLARLLRQRLERWLPARMGELARWAGSWRERVRKKFPDLERRRGFWETLLDGDAAARLLAGDRAGADGLAQQLLDDGTGGSTGRAWLVGAGPGDPGLISVRGLQLLEQADVVLHDRLVSPALLRSARRDAEIIAVGKTGGGPSARQEDINQLLIDQVRAGRRVCRLKGGDPLVFGRGAEEALALAQAGLPFEIVPGITAASACGAGAGIPLTHRGLATAVTLVTARGANEAAGGSHGPDWAALARLGQTLVVYMGGSRVDRIAADCVRHGWPASTPAAIITNGSHPDQEVLRGSLADIGRRFAGRQGLAPSLMIIGETVGLADRLAHGLAAEPSPAQPRSESDHAARSFLSNGSYPAASGG